MIAIGAPILVWSVHLASTDGGFVDGGGTGQWEWGEVVVGPASVGPVWATNLSGPYLHDSEDWLEIQLPEVTTTMVEPSLVLRHWYAIRSGDSAFVEVDDGSGAFVKIAPAYGYPDSDGFVGVANAYEDAVFNLSAFAAAPKVRLTLISDSIGADLGWYLSDVELWDGDILSPSVKVPSPPADTQDLAGPYVVTAQFDDDRGAPSATLWYTLDGGPAFGVPMAGNPAVAQIPGQPADTTVGMWVEASDGQNVGRWPVTGEHEFRVFLAAPTDLASTSLNLRPVADHVQLSWTAPVSPHPIEAYRVVREGSLDPLVETTKTSATVPLEPGDPQRFQVLAEYDVGLSDPSAVLDLDIEVPTLDLLDPASAAPGADVLVHLTGGSLYLAATTTVDFGSDIEILDVDVMDVGEAVLTVHVVHGATPGPRDLTVSGAAGTFRFPGVFWIEDPADAPQILAVDPGSVARGDTAEVVVRASVPFSGDVRLLADGDLRLGAPMVDGDVLTFSLTARADGRTGGHTLAIDDGDRLYTVPFEVTEPGTAFTSCSTAPAPGRGWWLLALLVSVGRPIVRRRAPAAR